MSSTVRSDAPVYRYSTRDILTLAVIAAVGGVVSAWAILPPSKIVEGALGPFGTAITNPFLIFWGVLAGVIVRKPGAAFLGSALTGVIEVLAGSLDGSIVLVFVAFQGLGAELGLLAFRYRDRAPAVFLACGLACAFGGLTSLYVFGFTKLPVGVQFGFLGARLVGGAVIGGTLAYLIARGLRRAGALGSAPR